MRHASIQQKADDGYSEGEIQSCRYVRDEHEDDEVDCFVVRSELMMKETSR